MPQTAGLPDSSGTLPPSLMISRSVLIIASFSIATAQAQNLKFDHDGIEVDAGSIGKFTMEYPSILDGSQKPAGKLVDRTIKGNAVTLNYDGGVQMILAIEEEGKVIANFAKPAPQVKNLSWDMHIPISFNQGGSWKAGDREAPFPVAKPEKPHLFQGNADTLDIQNHEGKTLRLNVPKYSFLQLSDNREWNWPIYHFKGLSPINADSRDITVSFSLLAASDAAKSRALVDKFGQSTLTDWPDKVKNEEDLKADLLRERAYFGNLNPPATDSFGGLPDSGKKLGLKSTGFFHLEKNGDRWILVDPEGNAFFHLGVCGFNPSDDFTLTKGRESAYEWLPKSDGVFASVFRKESGNDVLSFHLVNQVRKYAKPYSSEDYAGRMIDRVRKWGFNSIGAFSSGGENARQQAKFPSVAHLAIDVWQGVARIPGIHETFDPFDESTRKKIEDQLAKTLPEKANDPLIIGYFIVNEPIYEEIPRVVPSLKASKHACKAKFVEWAQQRYKNIAAFNQAWETTAASFDELKETALGVNSTQSIQDSEDFATVFLDAYMKFISETFRKHDKNHLLLGSRLQPATISHEWISRAMGKYVDVMSYNYYTHAVDLASLKRIYEWTGGKPMMLSEFYWASPKDSGLTGGREVNSQQERGLAYRNYVEQTAAMGFVVGIEWFTLVDQSVTGRWFSGFDGERANTGLMSVADRPWKAMLEEMMKTNYDIYKVWLGEKAPFRFEDPRFK